MHLISFRTIRQYVLQNAQAREELAAWAKQVEKAEWADFNALKADFPATDYIGDNRYVFNVKGNHYRVIAMVFFAPAQLYIRGIFTHAEYSKLSKRDIIRL